MNSIHSNTPLKTKTNEKQSLIIEKSRKMILTWFIDLHLRMTVTAVTVITFTPVVLQNFKKFNIVCICNNIRSWWLCINPWYVYCGTQDGWNEMLESFTSLEGGGVYFHFQMVNLLCFLIVDINYLENKSMNPIKIWSY
jgi:hypothetical protein